MDKKIGTNIYVARGIGALLIMIYHYSVHYESAFGKIEMPLNFNFAYLTFAVPMFFLFSSFFLYPKAKKLMSPIKIVVYRALRIYPMYWIAVFFSSLIRVIGGESISFFELLTNLTMIEEVFGVEAVDGAYWTMFYEIMLLMILASSSMIRIKGKKLVESPVLLVGIWYGVATVGATVLKVLSIDSSAMAVLMFGSRYVPVFVCGILFYEKYITKEIKNTHFLVMVFYGIVYQWCFTSWIQSIYSYIAILLSWVIISGKIVNVKFFRNAFFEKLGRISYNIYLTHNQYGRVLLVFFASLEIVSQSVLLQLVVLCMIGITAIGFAYLFSLTEKKAINRLKCYVETYMK